VERILLTLRQLEVDLDDRLEEHPAYSAERADELVAQSVALLALAIERIALVGDDEAALLGEIGAWLAARRAGVALDDEPALLAS